MNKAEVVDRVVGSSGLARQQVESVIDAFVDTVKSAVKSGDRIAWPGFGSFSSTSRKARTGRNPRTGAAVKIPASKAVKFGPSSALKDFLNPGAAAKKAGGGTKKSGGAATKSSAKKASGSKAPGKKAAASKAPAKKAAAKKAPAKKASSGAAKASAKRSASAKKATKTRSR